MSLRAHAEVDDRSSRVRSALIASLVLWAVFTAIHTLELDDPLNSILFFVPGVLGVAVLIYALGYSPADLYLRVAPISRAGIAALAAFSPFLVPILLTGDWIGWNWTSVLIYAPASGISQELFFRATLLPVFVMFFRRKPLLAIVLHSLTFGLWHLPLALITDPSGAAAITLVPLVGGLAWGWQVWRDKTVVWAMVHHTLFLMAMALFEWA